MTVLAAEKTREVFWDMPAGLEALWYVIAIATTLVFVYGVARPIVKYRRGNKVGWPPRSELPRRFRHALGVLVTQANLRRRDAYAGFAHTGIFYGFTVLFIGTVILAINTDFTEPVLGWNFFQGDFYLAYSVVLDVLGIGLLVGLLLMMIRRGIVRPRKLDYTRPDRSPDAVDERRRYRIGDWAFVLILLILVITGYVLEGARIAMERPGYNHFSPVGSLVAELFEAIGASEGLLGGIRHALWWSHGLLAVAFVAAIPYTKATHMLTSFASMVLQDPLSGKRLQPIDDEQAAEPIGYSSLGDFSALHLLQLDACTKCGKCHEACPALASGRPLSPRDVVLELREQANEAFDEVGIGGVLGALVSGGGTEATFDRPIVREDGVRSETIWSCMQCNACVEACPVGIEQAPIINQVRRHLVEDGDLPGNLQATFQVIHKSGNSFGERARKRGHWADELEFEIADARKEAVDVLWFVGDYASFDPRSQMVTRAIARLFHVAELDFGILYDGERNAGNDVRRAGEEGLYEALAEQNVSVFEQCDFNRIVTSDPHSLNTLRNEYPELLSVELRDSWKVAHHTGLLLELLTDGRLPLEKQLSYRVTYHDPCHLGRMNGEYDAPRQILEVIGCELVEMPRNRDNSFCCGAGGGRIWIPDEPGAERPSEARIREAVALGELDYFVVSCPKDVTMYEDAIKTSGHGGRIELRELTELLEEAADNGQAAGLLDASAH